MDGRATRGLLALTPVRLETTPLQLTPNLYNA